MISQFRHPLDSVVPLRHEPETLFFLYQIAFTFWEDSAYDPRYSAYVTELREAWDRARQKIHSVA